VIVVDTQLSVYFTIPVRESELARAVFERDAEWAAPLLWRSEFRNAMLGYVRSGRATTADALAAWEIASANLYGREHDVPTANILGLGSVNRITAYDLEFVVLASQLQVPLVTFDKELLEQFRNVAVHPSQFLTG
jgi:predicted nucleic acid-binding protein